ncbi:AgmX/PglI C-terminal domain-containing protein [Marinobacter mobilis]|uniref:AgmX/PglI C-terminal domain-containing protein n=1 Tax=Marinobacter mobilis TaxID=488533 RepID=UPI0035C6E6F1
MANRYGTRLPWSEERGDRLRFGCVITVLAVMFVVPAVWIPGIQLAEPDRAETEALPPQLARLMEKQPAPESSVDVVPESELMLEIAEAAERVDEVPEPSLPEPEPAPAPETVAPESATEPSERAIQQAREVAARSGLLALQDQLAQMRAPETSAPRTLTANAGPAESVADSGAPSASDALAGSGGVVAEVGPRREVQVAGHEVRQVAEPQPQQVTAAPVQPIAPSSRRGMNTIRQVFDAQKTVLYALYRRELRQDPTLEGKVLLELDIEPDGRVSRCEVVNSDLGNPALEARLASRVLLFDFGSDEVERRTVRFPIEFLPS